jgi:hypothetical protein
MDAKVEYSNNEGKWGCKYICQGISTHGYGFDKERAYNHALARWKKKIKDMEAKKNERKG